MAARSGKLADAGISGYLEFPELRLAPLPTSFTQRCGITIWPINNIVQSKQNKLFFLRYHSTGEIRVGYI